METNNSQDFADYFNECLVINQSKTWEDHNEDDSAKYITDADFEADWLRDIGFDSLVARIEAGKDVEDENFGMLFMSLTHHQAAVVKKKITTFKTTVRKRRLPKSRIRDVREVFPQASETSSGGTRSRSATPDSLDSISPSRTPPTPHEWDPCGGRGSPTLSQGYHSHTHSSPDLVDASHNSSFPYIDDIKCNEHDREPGFLRIFRTSSSGNESSPSTSDSSSSHPVSNQHHRSRTGNPEQQLSRLYKHGYDFSSSGTIDSDTGVEILDYQVKGSLSVQRGQLINNSHNNNNNVYLGLSENDITLEWQDQADTSSQKDITWGFERKVGVEDDSDLPEILIMSDKLGITRLEDLGSDDRQTLRTFALIELTGLFDLHDIQYTRRKASKKKKKDTENVFGMSLSSLLEIDQRINMDCKVPLILKKILGHLEKYGLKEEGILRVPGVVAKIQLLKREIEENFYSSPGLVDQALRASSVNDVAALVKQFLRDLPTPLLTNEYMDAFFQVDNISDKSDQIRALKLLIILLPDSHRDTLKALFSFLAKIVAHETHNRMNLQNVAMIIAPNLFLPKKLKKNAERDISSEINIAAVTCKVTKMMIKYQDILWIVPNFLIQQIRHKNENLIYRRRNSKENGKQAKKFLGKPKKTDIYRKIINEVDYQDGIIRLTAVQFGVQNMPVKLEAHTTAKDVVCKFITEFKHSLEGNNRQRGQRDLWRRALSELSPEGNLSCLVAIADPSTALDSHTLYEVGGNIGERCLDPKTNMIAVYQQNPNAEWEIRCKHWTNQPVVKEIMIM